MLPIYLLGFPFVVLWVLTQLAQTQDDDLLVLGAVAVVYAMVWPIVLPLDLGNYLLKRVRSRASSIRPSL